MNGTCVIPDQIEEIIKRILKGDPPSFVLQIDREPDGDRLSVIIEATDVIFKEEMKQQVRIINDIQLAISEFLSFRVQVKLVETGTAKNVRRVQDNRKI